MYENIVPFQKYCNDVSAIKNTQFYKKMHII